MTLIKKFPAIAHPLVLRLSLILVPLVSVLAARAEPPAGYQLAWSDEFNEPSLDTNKWNYWLLGPRRDAVNVTNAISLDGSNLVITTYTLNGTNYTGMVSTSESFHPRYGYWEARLKWGDTNGMWSAYWMQSPTMGRDLEHPVESGSEIDIAEHRFVDQHENINDHIQPNLHWNGYGAQAKSSGGKNYGSGLGGGFHVYGFLWTPTDYTIFIDGEKVRHWDFPDNHVPVSQSDEFMIFSSEVDDTSTLWAGKVPAGGYGSREASQTKLTVDYVRYYQPPAGKKADNASAALEAGWENPPVQARLRAYWWWLNGNVTRASISHDLTEMKAKGFGGAVLIDANGADQWGNAPVPHGPTFFSPEWRELYKFALEEAHRLGLEISLNIQSGWNLGGPVVKPDDAAKKYVWSETSFTGTGSNAVIRLTRPPIHENYYRESAVVAYRIRKTPGHEPLKNWKQKALQESLQPFSSPNSSALFEEIPGTAGEQDASVADVVDLTPKLFANGIVKWQAPVGEWKIFRFGYTIGDHAYVSTSSDGWKGFALDVYSAEAFQNYWHRIVEPLIADAGPLAGSTLKYLHTDSWEIELANWTPNLPTEFERRRGYDLRPWLPVLAGRIVNSREESDRFLFDYRKTLGDLAIDDHYRLFRDQAHRHGISIHPESGGPHAVPIDAQRCLGWDDAPMSEFWAWSWTHRIGDENRFFVKQPASAAHTYGHKLVFSEGFTTIGPNWQEKLWDNLKPSFDKALCEGMNVLVWHAFVCSPDETGIPGQQYFAGTHLNPKVTWWEKSGAFFNYINRCQWMLQQGRFAADALYYYGDHVPNFAQLKQSDPARLGRGYDYDVITEEALCDGTRVEGGKIVLPNGMTYRVLVLPDRDQIALPVLQKIRELVLAGATVIGPEPKRGETWFEGKKVDAEIAAISGELWAGQDGKGRVITNRTAREVLLADGVKPDCEFLPMDNESVASRAEVPLSCFDYIHRIDGGTDIYFVANRTNLASRIQVAFRSTGKHPQLWNPVTGERFPAAKAVETDGRTLLTLDFAPCGSWFVVFGQPALSNPPPVAVTAEAANAGQELTGPWNVHFDPRWGGPESVRFDQLVSWTQRPETGIKYYSGTATYETTFEFSAAEAKNAKLKVLLDLGNLRELAEVKINGKSCGILWCPPWREDITRALVPGTNKVQIEVVNFWPNRIIGDDSLPVAERLTRTNIRALTSQTQLTDSGLFGPVKLLKLFSP